MTVCPFAVWKPVQNHGGPMAAQLGLVLHVQEGNNSPAGWFNNPTSEASSTYWVSKAGVLEQFTQAEVCAWAQGEGNSTYQSVETEGYDTEPLTAAQESTLALLYTWGSDTYGWVDALAETPGAPGFGWHGMGGGAWGGHTGCPGDLRSARRPAILEAAFGGGPPVPLPTPEAPDMVPAPLTFSMRTDDEQVFYVDTSGRLMHYYYTQKSARWIGEPLSQGWDPATGLAHGVSPNGPHQVWGMAFDGRAAQCYFSGTQWVTEVLT